MKNDFLLSHPRNIFVIYFSSNSLFLNSCYMLSSLILKTILCNSDIFFNSSKSPSFIMAIFSTTNSHNSNVIVPKLLWQPLITKTNDHTNSKSL